MPSLPGMLSVWCKLNCDGGGTSVGLAPGAGLESHAMHAAAIRTEKTKSVRCMASSCGHPERQSVFPVGPERSSWCDRRESDGNGPSFSESGGLDRPDIAQWVTIRLSGANYRVRP